GSHHYDQRMVRHYLDAVKRAADKHIMVDAHEAVRPTGLARTYPNLVANESAMGQEFQEMSVQHCTILPFTRLKGGPMDFTPGIFEMDLEKTAPGNRNDKKATIANQLGLYMTMYSPLQMAADTPENYYKRMDAFQFIKDVPLDWSVSKYIDAEPGEFIVVARKDKNSENWYAGGVNAEEPRNVDLSLDFLEPGVKYEATIYADGKKADAYTNPHDYKITKRKVTAKDVLKLRMARGGGFAIQFTKL
ncbi:MAG: glycoside hydrolase family 97 catalytic domain-containing protein, partial [Muribaculaceae bacterium]|nr:glycoside hydrolase family 97 catalytic domain-containing protein [Muribaculaceae bacterium]